MLRLLRIENFALIEHLEIPFRAGLNVLTGETGAGKSIILDALDAALGGPARALRSGSERGLVEAVFHLNPELAAWLEQEQIDPLEEGLVCSRELLLRNGKLTSRSRVNGVLVNKAQMLSLRSQLVEITAQGQTVQIQSPQTQRRWLDDFGGEKLLRTRAEVAALYQTWNYLKTETESRRQNQQLRLQRLDLLQLQAQELLALRLEDPDELAKLERERDRLAHRVELQQQSYAAHQLLYQNDSGSPAIADLLGQAERLLQAMTQRDPDLAPLAEMLSSALIQVEEVGRELLRYGETLEADPGRLNKIERRLAQLRQACRKYGPTLAEVMAHAERVQAELAQLRGDNTDLEEWQARLDKAAQDLECHCRVLSQLRHQAARQLEEALLEELKLLGMGAVQFQVRIQPGPPTAEGVDQVSFWFSPNPGEPLQPLASIASGGEMSRFLLALKAVFSRIDPVTTMVFDEIDAGVSGKVAQAIATQLHSIAQDHQILCVTHQPLIAALADHHLRVYKVVQQKRTSVRVELLGERERREELAQLAAGHSAQEAMTFVEALLKQAAQLRQPRLAPLSLGERGWG
ncbi:DNA repair protein RecN [Synechococcus sp. H55.7]|uniref:DNA repair protein RecN n=1 Tax=unclassified Synechococcus TaxID=2626047 RepID=UPI0039C38356